jgi:hypothetical protein
MKQRRNQNGGWATAKGSTEKGLQVKCLISSEGHLWMRSYFDRLPANVRKRLSESSFNICAACMAMEARQIARERGVKASVTIYIETINRIELEMKSSLEARAGGKLA